MRTVPIFLIAMFTLAGLLLTSCGDDTQALTKDEFIAQADAICEASNDALTPVIDPLWNELDLLDEDDPGTPVAVFEAWEGVLDDAMAIWQRQLADISELAPPAEDEALITALLDDQADVLDEMDRLIRAGADGDETALALLGNDEDPSADVNRRAWAYGLRVCGAGE